MPCKTSHFKHAHFSLDGVSFTGYLYPSVYFIFAFTNSQFLVKFQWFILQDILEAFNLLSQKLCVITSYFLLKM